MSRGRDQYVADIGISFNATDRLLTLLGLVGAVIHFQICIGSGNFTVHTILYFCLSVVPHVGLS